MVIKKSDLVTFAVADINASGSLIPVIARILAHSTAISSDTGTRV
nr:hypothetical protein [Candidatus Sigynarchaeota archaeon]